MKAAVIESYRDLPKIKNIPIPSIGQGDVLIRVKAASLNPLDKKLQSGVMHSYFPLNFPYVLGTDIAGVIEKVGESVSEWQVGDRVLVRSDPTQGGAFAEYHVASASVLIRIPDTIQMEVAAGIATTGPTAWQALVEMAGLQIGPKAKGSLVVIHGGAGGVGSVAIQLAKLAGVTVITTVADNDIRKVKELGADQVISYQTQDFTQLVSNVDIVIDLVGGEVQSNSFKTLREGGLLISMVSPPSQDLAKSHSVRAEFLFHQSNHERLSKVVETLTQGLKVVIDQIYSIEDFPLAFSRLNEGKVKGKLVIRF
jgi:NADPH:quinone reductase-like Zn-dependent oxidoreductase